MAFEVHLHGICTHFRIEGQCEFHRVVLVNWPHTAPINGLVIDPHIPTLTLPSQAVISDGLSELLVPTAALTQGSDVRSYQLRGVRLHMGVPLLPPIPPEKATWLPSLCALGMDPGLAPDPNVLHGTAAACHVDFTEGTLIRPGGLVEAKIPANPMRYRVERSTIRVSALQEGGPSGTISGLDSHTVHISNECSNKSACNDWDFLLHYKTCMTVPPNARYPSPNPNFDGTGVGPGCSNSQFP